MRGGLVVLGLVCAPGVAHAGRNFYGWLGDTEVMPERGVELQSWLDEENHKDPSSSTEWGFAPYVGITDQLELAIPVETEWVQRRGTQLARYGADIRYRLVTQDPVDAPAFAPMVRFGVYRYVLDRDMMEANAHFLGSYESGSFHMVGDVGFVGAFGPDGHAFEIQPGAGVSIAAVGDLRFGGEVFAHLGLESGSERWVIVGPNAAWTHGRFWISATYGISLMPDKLKDAPRINWGIAF